MNAARRLAFPLLWAICLALLAGCGSDTGRSSVHGEVTFDGKPIEQGGIAFIPHEDGAGPYRATGQIVNGHYDLDNRRGPTPGKYRVQIHWRKKTGNKVPGEPGHMQDEIVEGLPPRYNEETELVRDVLPGRNKFDFPLTP